MRIEAVLTRARSIVNATRFRAREAKRLWLHNMQQSRLASFTCYDAVGVLIVVVALLSSDHFHRSLLSVSDHFCRFHGSAKVKTGSRPSIARCLTIIRAIIGKQKAWRQRTTIISGEEEEEWNWNFASLSHVEPSAIWCQFQSWKPCNSNERLFHFSST